MKALIYGINGKMGRVLTEEILKEKNITLLGGVSSSNAFNKDILVQSDLKNFEIPDVIIDFSHYSNLRRILNYAISNNVALVLATTGYSDADFKLIEDASKIVPIIYSSNYAIGIHTINKSIKYYLFYLKNFDIEIIEKHHKNKIDKPSGTALKFLKEINKYRFIDVPVHSLRSGNIVGEHTIIFTSDDEEIEITHKITSKRVFAIGAIKAAKFIVKQKPKLFDMDDLFGSDEV